MKLNKKGITGEEKLQKLQRITGQADARKKVKVFYPVNLEKVSNDVVLEGFRSDQPLAFNVVDFYKSGSDIQEGKYPFFRHMGSGFIGYFLASDTLLKNKNADKNEISSWIQSRTDDVINELSVLFGSSHNVSGSSFILGLSGNNGILFFYFEDGQFMLCEVENYALSLDVFSRNTGILETSMMRSMTAVISGCGSVGSYVALELARSGVGRFLLIDQDTVSYANVCRHQCGIADVGRYKTNAVADRIRLINPEAEIGIQNSLVENVPPAIFDRFCGNDSVIVGCADNRQGDLFACKIAAHYNMPMVSIGFWERAFAGEVFYWIPERTALACYQCFIKALGDISGRPSVNRRFYTTETDLSKVTFMPGISVDITFVTNVGVKIILDILNRKNGKFIPRLLDSLTQFTLIANTHKEEIGGPQAELFSYPLQVTTSIEVQKIPDCKICNKKAT